METLILHLLFWIINHGPLDRPKRINEMVARVEESVQKKDYPNAIRQLHYLVDSLHFTEPAARLDLAHSLFEGKDTLKARQQYQRLDSIADVSARSVALQQLGVLAGGRNENEQALAYFKKTLRADPTNEDARYDYELLKKKLQEQQKQDKQKEDKKDQKDQKDRQQDKNQQDQQKKDQQQQQQQDQKQKAQDQQQKEDQKGKEEQQKEQDSKDGKKSDERKATEQKLKEMNLSEEKARMILDAMKNSEIQYLQQKRREKSKKPDRNLPDW